MNTNNVLLNFIPIQNENFSFEVYIRRKNGEKHKPNDNTRLYNIFDIKENRYVEYWVSFNEFENSIKRTVESNENHFLTEWYLSIILLRKITAINLKFTNINNFRKNRIYIITEEITNKGKKSIWFEPYFLKSKNKFGYLIDYKFLKDSNVPFNKEIQKLSFSLDDKYLSNKNFHIDKYRYIKQFIDANYTQLSELTSDIKISKEFIKLETTSLKIKNYVFNNQQNHNSQFNGIINYGPYSSIQLNDDYKYGIIFHPDHKKYLNDLLKGLNGESFNTFKGIETIFKLPSFKKNNIIGLPINSFDNIPEEKLNNINLNLLLAIFPQKEEKFYYQLKYFCLLNDIPLQCIHLETILKENQLKWSLSGIALQMFTKLGGTPWLVTTDNKDCLIVGYGQSIEKDENNNIRRFYAYSVLIDSSGKFLRIEPLADKQNKEDFLKDLAKNVSKILNDESNKYKKIVFHIPEKISKKSIEIIKKTLEQSNTNLELYIIKINEDSKFFGYGNNNSFIPYESQYVQLSNKEFLLWTEGLNYHNSTPRKRYSNPLYIDFYYSNREKINYNLYLQDILNLSGVNYRGFNAKSLPVSLFYPKLISDFYKHFSNLDKEVKIKSENRLWFL
jgi:hypothetical protein